MTESIAPKSDQLNAEDLLTGPRTFTIADVKRGSVEQPIDVHLVEFPGRPFKPSKTVRRIMVAAWGADASAYAGRRLTLYRDPDVKFGGMDVGGIRVSHMSHLDKPLRLALAVSKGKRAPYNVQPLPDAPAAPSSIAKDALDAIIAGLEGLGITDRAGKLAAVSDVVGRPLGSARDLTAAEAADVLAWITAQSQPAADTNETITESEVEKLHVALAAIGLTEDEARLEYLTESLGREVTTSKSLSKTEVSTVLDRIAEFLDPTPPADASA